MVSNDPYSVDKLTAEARRLAADYRLATGKSLPISGEIAVNDAIRLLKLDRPPDGEVGYDAVRPNEPNSCRVQIKGRVVFDDKKGGARIGQLKLDQPWDEILLVLMDARYEPIEMFRATRESIDNVIAEKQPNKRGAMSVAQFKRIGERVWASDDSESTAS